MKLTWVTAALLYAVLTVAFTWPVLGAMATVLPSDIGDPGLVSWVLWWNAQVMPLTERWWNAPMFYPASGAFALSETMLGLAPWTTPVQWAGASPVFAHNLTYVLSFFISALCAHALARDLTGRHDVALLAGLAFGFSPYRASQTPHLHLLVSWWMPLALLALHRFLRERRPRDLVLFGLCWLLNGLTTGYYLIYFAVLVGCWLLWFVRTRRDWLLVLATIVVASLPFVPLLSGYTHYQRAMSLSRGIGEVETFSADLSAFWAVSPFVWLPRHWTVASLPEGELYPGALVIGIAMVGGVLAWRRRALSWTRAQRGLAGASALIACLTLVSWMVGGWTLEIGGFRVSMNRPHRSLTFAVWLFTAAILSDRRLRQAWQRRSVPAFFLLAAGVMALFALGPAARVFGERFLYKAPYAWLMELPGGDALRVPARFGILAIVCLTQALALLAARFWPGRMRPALLAALSLFIVLDGWPAGIRVAATPSHLDLQGLDPALPVLELPAEDLYADTAAMLRATSHRHPIFNGFSGYVPQHFEPMKEGMRVFDPGTFMALQEIGPLLVVVNGARDPEGRYARFVAEASGAAFVRRAGRNDIFLLPRLSTEVATLSTVPLPIAAVRASDGEETVTAMTDGRLGTRWDSERPQEGGMRLIVDLRAPSTITRVEFDITDLPLDFPRGLRVEFASGGGPPRVVWSGGTAGQAVRGALADQARLPVVLDVAPAEPADQIILTLTSGDDEAHWSIAELRVFGTTP